MASGSVSIADTHAVMSTNRPGPTERRVESRRRPGAVAYLLAYGLQICGMSIMALFCAAIMTRAGGHQNGALLTACYLALSMIAAAVAIPLTPAITQRWGLARGFGVAVAAMGLASVALGMVILLGGPAAAALLLFAPVVGFLGGVAGVLNLIVARTFLGGEDMSKVSATISVTSGLAWGTGALIAGFGLQHVSFGVGPSIAGLLCLPMVALMAVRPPQVAMHKRHASGLAAMRRMVRSNDRLRSVVVVTGLICIFAMPMAALVVPIVDQLRQTPLLPGAGIVLFAMALGALLTPVIVRQLCERKTLLARAGTTVMASGGALMIMAVSAQFTTDKVQLGIWFFVGIVFGAARFATRALLLGACVNGETPEDATVAVAAVRFVSHLAAPIGVLTWGVLIHFFSVAPVLYCGAIATLILGVATVRHVGREPSLETVP